MERQICPWAKGELYIAYHDNEWGKPLHDERGLYELLVLEGMQAGLSWLTVLKKREAFREAFDGFDPEVVARYTPEREELLMGNAAIIRNRLKIHAAVQNAQAFLRLQQEEGGFDRYLWGFVDGEPVNSRLTDPGQMPARTELSDRLSAGLRRRGFRFAGSTICYSYMQAAGLVNDHLVWCDQYANCQRRT